MSNRDHELLAFLLGELPLLRRLDVRLRLAVSAAARQRLVEMEQVAGAVAGAIGAGDAAAFRANQRLKVRRCLVLDLAVAVVMLLTIGIGGAVVWRTLRPQAASCVIGPPAASSEDPAHPVKKDARRAEMSK